MGKVIFPLLALFIFNQAFSQNFIPNGDFELKIMCPEEKGHIETANFWYSPNAGNPDYFNACYSNTNPIIVSLKGAGIPINYMGVGAAHNGEGMAGLYLHKVESGLIPWKEYMQVKLAEKVKKKRSYCFKAQVRLSGNSVYASSNFEVLFSKGKVKSDNAFTIQKEAQLKLDSGNYLHLQDEWMEICMPYVPKKKARYVTIGNFQPVDLSENLVIAPRSFKVAENFAYYFIDDISLEQVNNVQECGCENSFDYRTWEEEDESFALAVNEPHILENIRFAVDSSHFEILAHDQLDVLLDILNENPKFYLSLVGYTDDTGDKKHNFELSLSRAESVKAMLQEKGIDTDRIFCNGLGDAFPLSSNINSQNRADNRRVEFTIMKRAGD